MNEIRYWIALIMICLIPGTLAHWFTIHPFVRFWRLFGASRTLVLSFTLSALIAVAVATQRRWLLSIEFGNNLPLAALGIALLILAGILRGKLGSDLKLSTLVGLPELDPPGRPQPLMTSGVYSVVRHPRYVQVLLGLWGWTFLANYLALYVIAASTVALIDVLVRLEEKELRDRYGSAYADYAKRVPRFVPRLTGRR